MPKLNERYVIQRELGRGGMATVYLADDLKHHRQVAIKVLDRELAQWIGKDRFLREIEVTARLTHPHILALHDSGAVDGLLYYVTPYVAGGSLRDRLKREGQLLLEDALRIAREIASALGHAHHEGLVHRDVKPENILLSDGIALVADFGISRVASAGATRFTTVGTVMGTPAYIAPEQAAGSAEVDARADLYSLGCVLYEMLAGQPPFTGPSDALMRQHLSVEPRPVTDLRPNVPAAVSAVVARCLAKLPSDRFSTAARFAEALDAALAGGATPDARHPAAAPTTPHNLPRQRTPFIGRERELAECVRALGDARILTITGIGGSGKTRLGLKLAETLRESFRDGVWFVNLAPLNDADRVVPTLAAVLDVREERGSSLLQTVVQRLRDKRTLIVLDSCEHVLSRAAELVDALISASGDLKVIVTSREGLGVEGERLFALRSLSVPASAVDLKAIEASEAVRLFMDRARMRDDGFVLTAKTAPAIAEICRRLDGIPLAIELAAGRITVLTPEDIAARLDDRFRLLTGGSKTALPRHQTLRATIQWSYDQLTEDERRLFRLVSVFAGGWTLESAARLTGNDTDEFEVLELMTRLVGKSLVTADRGTQGGSRYAMLETVRQYAQERLSEAGEADVARARHLDYFLELVEAAEAQLRGPDQGTWMARLVEEQDNLLGAHAWCGQSGAHAEQGLRLVGALRRFFLFTGSLELGRRVASEAVEHPGAQARSLPRAKALFCLSNMEFFLSRHADSLAHGEASLAIARELGNTPAICDGLHATAHARTGIGDLAGARLSYEEFVALARNSADVPRLASALGSLAEFLRLQGDLESAEPLYVESLELTRAIGDPQNVVISLFNLGAVAIMRNALERARAHLIEAGSIVSVRNPRAAGGLVDFVAAWHAEHERWLRAARWFGAAQSEYDRIGASEREPVDESFMRPRIERTRAALGDDAFETAWREGGQLDIESAVAEVRAALEHPDNV